MLPLTVIFLTVFIDLVGFGMIIPLTPYLGKTFGADAFAVGLLMAAYSAFQFFFSPVWGRLSDRVGRRPILLMSLFGSAISHLLFGLAGTLTGLFLARA
jgi:DHA1 family tetracycline resistance protein-like MFS transporter